MQATPTSQCIGTGKQVSIKAMMHVNASWLLDTYYSALCPNPIALASRLETKQGAW